MPELPEVETIARGVDARVRGDRIVEAWFGIAPRALQDAARAPGQGPGRAHHSGRASHRQAHCLRAGPSEPPMLEASRDAQWIVHLGMTGRLLVTTPEARLAAHTHARLTLASGRELRFVDPRRFGRLEFRDLSRTAGFERSGRRSADH